MLFGSVNYEAKTNAKGQINVWLAEGVVNRLKMLRGPGESYSDVIIRPGGGGTRLTTQSQTGTAP
jgi:hypothetical protein